MSPSDSPMEFDFRVPPEVEAGVYANLLAVWHTAYEFTLDFAVAERAQPSETGVKVPCLVVSRVKIPVTLIFEVLKALNANMTQYEAMYGEVHAPEARNDEEDG